MTQLRRLAFTALAALSVAACAALPGAGRDAPAAERPGPRGMVSAANPLAAQAGLEVLKRGGSAVDAAVAVQAVLGLVEPQSSGLGGGAFLVHYDAETRAVTAYDGRETAPAAAGETLFLGEDGKPIGFVQAVLSGRATGAPGAVAMLAMAHERHGTLPWNSLFGDAERLADQGFTVSPRLAGMIASRAPQASAPDAVAYFTKPDGTKYVAGDVLRNPAYAATVRKIAAEGRAALLQGEIAEAIVARVRQGPLPGEMTLEDLASYQPKSAPAVCRPYRVYVVCTAPPPSSGAALLEGLGLLERTEIAGHGPDSVKGWRLFAEASRLMYADRDRYFGDPAFVDVPVAGLLDPAYLDARARLIDAADPTKAPAPGRPAGAGVRAPDATREPEGTSHFTIVDAAGDVVSMTTTVESIFGTGRMVHGFFLNNQLTDFSFSPVNADGTPAANAVAGGKRPRSSMSPLIVLDGDGNFVAALGSPGGNAILAYNLKTAVGVLDWGLSMQAAIDLPNLIARGATYASEVDKFPPGVVAGLAAEGVKLSGGSGAEGSGLHGIRVTPQGLEGGADPRREGVALAY